MKKLALTVALSAALLSGCAQVPPNAGENPADPYESFNRNVWAFNDTLDRAIVKPVSEFYVDWTPEFVQTGVSNFFDNLDTPGSAVNNLLQGKVERGVRSVFRFLVNSTLGIAGLFDVASHIGLEDAPEDFGQTLAVWGVGQGSYLVLPFLGPTTTRDWTRYPVSWGTDPLTYIMWDEDWYWSVPILAAEGIDARARLLSLESIRAQTVDDYAAIRDAYLAMRERAVRDGAEVSSEEELETLTPLQFDDEEE
ncbi:VacJ family lipoprotein [Sutterella sp.]|uniref:MlaA family lipoprotein n=1 Tax=Sutterella sp. TaxID=1981025 RepID=UPI0026E0357D|nr:VacJ family lipoprotein [Sutterella sp.]MDO5531278.1 VacJ family lipoprotein [Sutterella sp.]